MKYGEGIFWADSSLFLNLPGTQGPSHGRRPRLSQKGIVERPGQPREPHTLDVDLENGGLEASQEN